MDNFNKTLLNRFLKYKEPFSNLISWFGVLGIFIGVFSLIFVISIMRGFQNQLVSRLIGTQPHIYINLKEDKYAFSNYKEFIEELKQIKKMKILSISPYIETEAISVANNVTFGNVVFAVDNEFLQRLFNKNIEPVFIEEREVYVGNQFSAVNNLIGLDKLNFISAWDLIFSNYRVPQQRVFNVKGDLKTGSYARDLKYVYMNIEDAMNYFSSKKSHPNGVAVLVKDVDKVKNYKDFLLNNFENINVETWQDRNEKLFYSLKLERLAMFFLLIFIIIVASFSILSSLVLFVESKQTDFAVLFSLGYSKKDANKMLIILSFKKALKAALLGGALAWFILFLIKTFKIISLPDIYYDTHLPVKIDMYLNILIIIGSIFICTIGSIYPISRMKKIDITKLIRRI